MVEKLGRAKYGLPVIVVVLISCVMALMFYPLIGMSPRELPFAVLSLDQGAQTELGDVNVGEMLVERLVNAEAPAGADAAPIAWERFASQDDVDRALADNELFGALTVPADFTRLQGLAQAGQGEAPSLSVVIDNAKSPMAAAQLQVLLRTMFETMDMPAEVQVINAGEPTAGPTSSLAGMMSQQVGVLPLVIMALIGSILLTRIFPVAQAGTVRGRFVALGKQGAYAVGYTFLAGTAATILLNTLVGAGIPFWTATVFGWVASLCVLALFLGAFNLGRPVGVLVALYAVLCAMMTATLPREMLPTFWADWVYPFTPQHMIADGVRDILYRGAELMPNGTTGLLAIGGVGLVLIVVAGLAAKRPGRLAAA